MKKLTKAQKTKNARAYKQIKKGYDTSDKSIPYIAFKHRVQARMAAENKTVKEAVKKELNTETFTTAAERSRTNFVNAIKKNYRETYNELRNLSRYKGKYVSIVKNLEWDTTRNGYILGGKYFIDVTNSPEEINIYAI